MTAQYDSGESMTRLLESPTADSNRYEYVEYETGDDGEMRAVLHDTRNDQAWLDSSITVAVTQ